MAMAAAVQGGLRPSQTITWADEDGNALNLTGATVTGTITNVRTGVTRAIAGTLTVVTASDGVFRWDYHADDVADAGVFRVQFSAAFGAGQSPARSQAHSWTVHRANTVS